MEIEIQKWLCDAHFFRNILAHGYDHIDHEVVRGIIEDDLPDLVESVKKQLKS